MRISDEGRLGRTAGGQFTTRFIEMEPGDFPPDSRYWEHQFNGSKNWLRKRLGESELQQVLDLLWPGVEIEEYTWEQLSDQLSMAVTAYNCGARTALQIVTNISQRRGR